MAWQTQMQQAYGTGPGGGAPGTLAQAFGRQSPQMPPGMLASAFGAQTPGRQPTQPQTPFTLTSGPNAEVGANTRTPWGGMATPSGQSFASGAMTPQAQAAQAQARWNGMFGAMPTARVKDMRDQGGFAPGGAPKGKAAGGITAPPAMAGAMNAAAPGIFNGNPETGIPAAEGGYAPRAASGGGATETREPLNPSTPPTAAASTTPTGTTPVTYDPQNSATYWNNQTGSGNWSAQNVAGDNRGDQRWAIPQPTGWENMTPAEREAWKVKWYNPYQTMSDYYASAPDELAMTAFRRAYSADPFYGQLGNMPATASAAGLSGNALAIAADSDPAAWAAQYGITDPSVTAALSLLRGWGNTIQSADNMPVKPEHFANLVQQYGDLSGVLKNVYGINYDPRSYQATPDPSNTGNEAVDLPANTTLDTSVPDVTTKVPDLLQAIGGKIENAPLIETAMNMEMYRRSLEDRQKGVNILDNVVKDTMASNNPLRARSEELALSSLNNPDPVDWTGIKNRMATDYGRDRSQSATSIAEALAGRGLDAGAGAGITAQMNSQNRMSLARALGELTTKEQQGRQSAIYDAIANAGNVDRNYRGAESTARQILANAVMGTPQAAANPYAGITNYRLGQQASQIQQDAIDEQATAAKNAMIGNLVGSIFGSASRAASGGIG